MLNQRMRVLNRTLTAGDPVLTTPSVKSLSPLPGGAEWQPAPHMTSHLGELRMHLVAEFTTLGSLLAVCAAIGAVAGYTLQHLRRKPNPRGDFAITVSIVGPALALMLLVQLFTTPSYSLL